MDVMAIDRTDVLETELLEKHATNHAGFHSLLDLGKESFGGITEQRQAV
jgi:hypothetical protein